MIVKGYGGRRRLIEDRREMAQRMREYFDESTRGHRVKGWGRTEMPGATVSPPLVQVHVSIGDAQWTYLDGGVDMDAMRAGALAFFEARGYVVLSTADANYFHGRPGGIVDLQDRRGFRVKIEAFDAAEQKIYMEMFTPYRWCLTGVRGDDLRDAVADAMEWKVEG